MVTVSLRLAANVTSQAWIGVSVSQPPEPPQCASFAISYISSTHDSSLLESKWKQIAAKTFQQVTYRAPRLQWAHRLTQCSGQWRLFTFANAHFFNMRKGLATQPKLDSGSTSHSSQTLKHWCGKGPSLMFKYFPCLFSPAPDWVILLYRLADFLTEGGFGGFGGCWVLVLLRKRNNSFHLSLWSDFHCFDSFYVSHTSLT